MHDLIPVFDNPVHPWINRTLKEQALHCPECGAPSASLNLLSEDCPYMPHFAVVCCECKHLGPFGKNTAAAIKNWNKGQKWKLQDGVRRMAKRWKRYWR